MTDELKPLPGETPATATETGAAQDKATETTATETGAETFDEARAKELIAKLRKENRELGNKAKRADELEQAEQKRKDAELSETDRLRKELAEANAKAAQAARDALVQRIAAETGLPVIFADRLKGDDEEALREDAAKLLETIKTPAAQKQAKVEPTMPTNGAKPESEAQKANRILRPAEAGPFDIEGAKKLGGGVIINNG